MKQIILIGGGGHCGACIDVIEALGGYKIVGIVDKVLEDPKVLSKYPWIGSDEDLPQLLMQTSTAMVTVGQIKTPETRMRLYLLLKSLGANFPVIQSPIAYRSPNSTIGDGTILMHGSVVNAGAKVAENCIINSQALIEHDVEISAHCHISTGAKINGGVFIDSGCFIGSGAILKEGIRIGKNVIIGAGQVVLQDISGDNIIRRCHD